MALGPEARASSLPCAGLRAVEWPKLADGSVGHVSAPYLERLDARARKRRDDFSEAAARLLRLARTYGRALEMEKK